MSLNLYLPIDHKKRAAQHRRDARELSLAGFPVLAEVNWEMAEWLDPTPREKPEPRPRRRQHSRPAQNGNSEVSQPHSNTRTGLRNPPRVITPRLPIHNTPTPIGRQIRARP